MCCSTVSAPSAGPSHPVAAILAAQELEAQSADGTSSQGKDLKKIPLRHLYIYHNCPRVLREL